MSKEIGLRPERLQRGRMSVHLVNMAEPKEGPSAGVAFALAMYSAATGMPIRRGLAVTGELSVHGHVGQIGGVLEKLQAAVSHRRSVAIIPMANAADLARTPELFESMKIEPVASLLAALQIAIPRAFPHAAAESRYDLRPFATETEVQFKRREVPPSITDMVSNPPPDGQRLLSMLAEDLDLEEIPALAAKVEAHAMDFDAPQHAAVAPVQLAHRLRAQIETLLKIYPSLPERHRRLVVGAARYFCSDDDVKPDFESMSGLDDDLEVLNWVAREIGRSDLVIHV